MYTSKAIHRGKFISTNMYQIRRIVSVDELKITKASLTQKRQKGESKEDEKKKNQPTSEKNQCNQSLLLRN